MIHLFYTHNQNKAFTTDFTVLYGVTAENVKRPGESYTIDTISDVATLLPSYTAPGFGPRDLGGSACVRSNSDRTCPTFQYARLTTKYHKAASKSRAVTLKAGSSFSYTLMVKDRSGKLSQVLASGAAELVFFLPPNMAVRSIRAKPRTVTLKPMPVSNGDVVWLLQDPAGGKPIASVTVRAEIAVSPCAPSGSTTIRAAFFPLGESTPSCNVGLDRQVQATVWANPSKCNRAQRLGKHW